MIGFVCTLVALLAGACLNSRDAWSFSADVPSPVLASIIGEESPEAASAESPQDGGTIRPGGENAGPAAAADAPTSVVDAASATPMSESGETTAPAASPRSPWPARILGFVVVVGLVLIGVWLKGRDRGD